MADPNNNEGRPENSRNALKKLDEHINELSQEPTHQQDESLMRIIAYGLSSGQIQITEDERVLYVTKIYGLLPTVTPAPSSDLLKLLNRFLEGVPLDRILDIPKIDLAQGLSVGENPIIAELNNVTLDLLMSATESSASRLATNRREVFEALVKLWLSTSEIGVSSKAKDCLLLFIERGKEDGSKRFFRDKDVYGLVFNLCQSGNDSFPMSSVRRSTAQSRLLEFATGLAKLDWTRLTTSHLPEVEQAFGLKKDEGLLDFAMRYCTKYQDDIIMHRYLFITMSRMLMDQKARPRNQEQSPALQWFKARGLHDQPFKIWLNLSYPGLHESEISLLLREAARYTATFINSNPGVLQTDKALREKILSRLQSRLRAADWNYYSPELIADLEVLGLVPRFCLVQNSDALLEIQYKKPIAYAIGILGDIFRGPELRGEGQSESSSNSDPEDQRNSRVLFERFVQHYPDFINTLTEHGNRNAIPDVAIMSVRALQHIVDSNWDQSNGLQAIMSDDSTRQHFATFLLGQPQRPSGNRDKIAESLQELAERRLGLLNAVVDRLHGTRWTEMIPLLQQRANAGPFGSVPVGQAIATLGGPS